MNRWACARCAESELDLAGRATQKRWGVVSCPLDVYAPDLARRNATTVRFSHPLLTTAQVAMKVTFR